MIKFKIEDGPPVSKLEVDNFEYMNSIQEKIKKITDPEPWKEMEEEHMYWKEFGNFLCNGGDMEKLRDEQLPYLIGRVEEK